MSNLRENIIRNYIESYNNFDVEGMMKDLDDSILFLNVSDEKVNLKIEGISHFKTQAEQAKAYFSERKQTILSLVHQETITEIMISYRAVLAMDFPNGLKKRDELNLEGKSIFEFKNDKITTLADIDNPKSSLTLTQLKSEI